MSDCYRLEWIHSMKTILSGIGESLQRDTFQDTLIGDLSGRDDEA